MKIFTYKTMLIKTFYPIFITHFICSCKFYLNLIEINKIKIINKLVFFF